MPLPNGGIKWVPGVWRDVYEDYAIHDAWYSGDPNRLSTMYASAVYTPTPRGKFWSQQIRDERRTMIHVPIAGDIAGFSADLLFAEKPKIKIPEAHIKNAGSDAKATQERIDEILRFGDVFSRLHEAAENCSPLGGVFLKPVWDKSLANFPILSVAQADNAFPRFKFGILQDILFWKVIDEETKQDHRVVWRLVECYERGQILTGLYKGETDNLGIQYPLTSRADTADIAPIISTNVPDDLLCRYIPNTRPNRKRRGSSLGQSDYAGIEGLMDALDEVYSSWMRDIRLGRGRIIVPESYLQRTEDGQFRFDIDQEIFTALEMDPLSAGNEGITLNQFNIRTKEHKETASELAERIISHAGYSPQSFGLEIQGRAQSGTALNQRERRTFSTGSKKQEYWKSAIEDVLEMMLKIDRLHLGNMTALFRPSVEMQDNIKTDPMQVADSIQKLRLAQILSIDTGVRMAHPDWTDEQIISEVDKVTKENGLSMPDPMQTGLK